MQKNRIYYILAYSVRMVATLCATGSLMQTFLSALGFSARMIYIHSTAIQAAMVISILLGARWADNKSLIKRMAVVQLPNAALFLVYIPVCIAHSASFGVYVLLIIAGAVQSVATGLFTVCDYKIPYYIFIREEYGTITGICGAIGSVLSLLTGAVISWLTGRYTYIEIMIYMFILSFVCMAVSGWCTYKLKIITDIKPQELSGKDKIPLSVMFRHPAFIQLFSANLFRGISAGIVNVLAAVALDIGFDEGVTTAMVSVQSASTLIACTGFAYVARIIKPRAVVFCGSIFFILLPVFMFVGRTGLLVVYALIVFGRTLVDYAVPASLLFVVPAEIAGTYNSWRMILNNGGMLIATAVASVLPVEVLLTGAAMLQIISGISFVIMPVMKDKKQRI